MDAKFIQDGKTIDYTPAVDTAAGDVIIAGKAVGVAATDIPAGVLGSLITFGVFEVAKAADAAFAFGDPVYWSAETKEATTDDTCELIGYAAAPVVATDATMRVKLG